MKLKFTLPSFLLVAGLLSSCLSEPDLENIPQETARFIPIEETDEASIFPLKTASYAEFGVLGHGYDVTKDYAIEDGFSNKGQVIDIQKISETEKPISELVVVESNKVLIQETTHLSGSDAAEYTSKLTYKSGLDPLVPVFGGAVKAVFGKGRNEEKEFDGKEIYGTWELYMKEKAVQFLFLDADEENISLINIRKKYLSESFVEFIEKNSAQSIVKNFGTHVITRAYIGAKVQISYQAETNKQDRNELAYHKLPLVFYPDQNETFNEVYTWRTIGGDTSIAVSGRHDLSDGTPPPISWVNWQKTITDENNVLIGFITRGLIPIYFFIQDPIKKAEVKAYVDQYISDNSVKTFHKKTNIHRLHDKKGTNHIYTTEPSNERLNGFDYEGVSFQAYTYNVPGTIPINRFYNTKSSDHVFSINYQGGNYEFEKIAFYAFESEVPGTKPIFSSKKTKGNNTHQLLTADITEHQNALKNGYADEGIVFYAY